MRTDESSTLPVAANVKSGVDSKTRLDADRQRRYQAPDMVNDGSEFRNIFRNLHPGQDAAWLQEHVDYDLYYRYSAVTEAIRHGLAIGGGQGPTNHFYFLR